MPRAHLYALHIALVSCVFVYCGLSQAQAVYVPSYFKATFGDGLAVNKHKAGYYKTYSDADNYSGYEYGQHRFELGSWTAQGQQLSYVSKSRDSEGTSKNVTVGVNTLDGASSLWTADTSYAKKLAERTTAEISFARDRVEVQPSLATNVFANNYNASIEQKTSDATRVQLTFGEMRYTDGNRRPLTKMKATYDVLPEYGVNVQLRSRYFRDTNTAVNSGYFNPYRFVENIAAVEVNQTVAGWLVSGNVGYGRQAGGDDPKTLAKAFEFSGTTPLSSDVFVRLKAGYFRSLGYQGPDFIYRYVGEDIVIRF